MSQNVSLSKQKGLGFKPSPNYYQATVNRIITQTDITQSNYM
jgi:hypothetical protein